MANADASGTTNVYHGTSRDAADTILRDGFVDVELLDAHGRPVSGVFVTSDAAFAAGYGEVVLAVEIDAATATSIADDIERWDETLLPAATLNRCPVVAVTDP
jgi:hypothetical protein